MLVTLRELEYFLKTLSPMLVQSYMYIIISRHNYLLSLKLTLISYTPSYKLHLLNPTSKFDWLLCRKVQRLRPV